MNPSTYAFGFVPFNDAAFAACNRLARQKSGNVIAASFAPCSTAMRCSGKTYGAALEHVRDHEQAVRRRSRAGPRRERWRRCRVIALGNSGTGDGGVSVADRVAAAKVALFEPAMIGTDPGALTASAFLGSDGDADGGRSALAGMMDPRLRSLRKTIEANPTNADAGRTWSVSTRRSPVVVVGATTDVRGPQAARIVGRPAGQV